jgi:hypothetical protein
MIWFALSKWFKIYKMNENPYEPPKVPASQHPYANPKRGIKRMMFTLAVFLGTTTAGLFFGVMSGIVYLATMPRANQPLCGNSILEPAMFIGMIMGMALGAVMVRRLYFRSS